jgi:hypothetical protein
MDKASSAPAVVSSPDYRTADDFINRYANHTFFEPSLFDMRIVFGQTDQRAGQNVVDQHTAITLPWPQVKIAIYFLSTQLAAYEALHGRVVLEPGIIPSIPEEPVKVTGLPHFTQALSDKVWAAGRPLYEKFVKDNPEAGVIKTK